jgi:hypothetical protein
MGQVGDLRPGFLHDDSSSLQGPVTPRHLRSAFRSTTDGSEAEGPLAPGTVTVKLRKERDPNTGEIRFVQE